MPAEGTATVVYISAVVIYVWIGLLVLAIFAPERVPWIRMSVSASLNHCGQARTHGVAKFRHPRFDHLPPYFLNVCLCLWMICGAVSPFLLVSEQLDDGKLRGLAFVIALAQLFLSVSFRDLGWFGRWNWPIWTGVCFFLPLVSIFSQALDSKLFLADMTKFDGGLYEPSNSSRPDDWDDNLIEYEPLDIPVVALTFGLVHSLVRARQIRKWLQAGLGRCGGQLADVVAVPGRYSLMGSMWLLCALNFIAIIRAVIVSTAKYRDHYEVLFFVFPLLLWLVQTAQLWRSADLQRGFLQSWQFFLPFIGFIVIPLVAAFVELDAELSYRIDVAWCKEHWEDIIKEEPEWAQEDRKGNFRCFSTNYLGLALTLLLLVLPLSWLALAIKVARSRKSDDANKATTTAAAEVSSTSDSDANPTGSRASRSDHSDSDTNSNSSVVHSRHSGSSIRSHSAGSDDSHSSQVGKPDATTAQDAISKPNANLVASAFLLACLSFFDSFNGLLAIPASLVASITTLSLAQNQDTPVNLVALALFLWMPFPARAVQTPDTLWMLFMSLYLSFHGLMLLMPLRQLNLYSGMARYSFDLVGGGLAWTGAVLPFIFTFTNSLSQSPAGIFVLYSLVAWVGIVTLSLFRPKSVWLPAAPPMYCAGLAVQILFLGVPYEYRSLSRVNRYFGYAGLAATLGGIIHLLWLQATPPAATKLGKRARAYFRFLDKQETPGLEAKKPLGVEISWFVTICWASLTAGILWGAWLVVPFVACWCRIAHLLWSILRHNRQHSTSATRYTVLPEWLIAQSLFAAMLGELLCATAYRNEDDILQGEFHDPDDDSCHNSPHSFGFAVALQVWGALTALYCHVFIRFDRTVDGGASKETGDRGTIAKVEHSDSSDDAKPVPPTTLPPDARQVGIGVYRFWFHGLSLLAFVAFAVGCLIDPWIVSGTLSIYPILASSVFVAACWYFSGFSYWMVTLPVVHFVAALIEFLSLGDDDGASQRAALVGWFTTAILFVLTGLFRKSPTLRRPVWREVLWVMLCVASVLIQDRDFGILSIFVVLMSFCRISARQFSFAGAWDGFDIYLFVLSLATVVGWCGYCAADDTCFAASSTYQGDDKRFADFGVVGIALNIWAAFAGVTLLLRIRWKYARFIFTRHLSPGFRLRQLFQVTLFVVQIVAVLGTWLLSAAGGHFYSSTVADGYPILFVLAGITVVSLPWAWRGVSLWLVCLAPLTFGAMVFADNRGDLDGWAPVVSTLVAFFAFAAFTMQLPRESASDGPIPKSESHKSSSEDESLEKPESDKSSSEDESDLESGLTQEAGFLPQSSHESGETQSASPDATKVPPEDEGPHGGKAELPDRMLYQLALARELVWLQAMVFMLLLPREYLVVGVIAIPVVNFARLVLQKLLPKLEKIRSLNKWRGKLMIYVAVMSFFATFSGCLVCGVPTDGNCGAAAGTSSLLVWAIGLWLYLFAIVRWSSLADKVQRNRNFFVAGWAFSVLLMTVTTLVIAVEPKAHPGAASVQFLVSAGIGALTVFLAKYSLHLLAIPLQMFIATLATIYSPHSATFQPFSSTPWQSFNTGATVLAIVSVACIAVYVFLQDPVFGKPTLSRSVLVRKRRRPFIVLFVYFVLGTLLSSAALYGIWAAMLCCLLLLLAFIIRHAVAVALLPVIPALAIAAPVWYRFPSDPTTGLLVFGSLWLSISIVSQLLSLSILRLPFWARGLKSDQERKRALMWLHQGFLVNIVISSMIVAFANGAGGGATEQVYIFCIITLLEGFLQMVLAFSAKIGTKLMGLATLRAHAILHANGLFSIEGMILCAVSLFSFPFVRDLQSSSIVIPICVVIGSGVLLALTLIQMRRWGVFAVCGLLPPALPDDDDYAMDSKGAGSSSDSGSDKKKP
jgi:hypothetical protein